MQPTKSSASLLLLHPVDSVDLPKQMQAMHLIGQISTTTDDAAANALDEGDDWGWFEDLTIHDEAQVERFESFHLHDLSHQSFE
ncbi:hypothetical protein H257_14823 [Aphanomyces astaci]|uniref:Uncharacterized protein n=1 Tax=Aphanomyces astaci TaxID=112090 RepID=W4FPQ6_APHAT|nr:hypothetical protein H257_14823 [Aphanomyces astaci]ETV69450.1 hypothetical protein H257_14823 [Aphanomyces astaci]KAF0756288.1 hypothetical protein AaE_004697 [Aphanomyces astaci]|eukprot:XP_009841023.1 hypothetical protein H257_14823 [Aphanomyces astaci]